ncbi:hypothetical protein VTN00DRAFT_1924 [Thermoascus crustaceus]|uniref:uncharacterized protein n=1 Tax=Thermoascus crustaceus TaxID=5088 RepID=UPI00374308BB
MEGPIEENRSLSCHLGLWAERGRACQPCPARTATTNRDGWKDQARVIRSSSRRRTVGESEHNGFAGWFQGGRFRNDAPEKGATATQQGSRSDESNAGPGETAERHSRRRIRVGISSTGGREADRRRRERETRDGEDSAGGTRVSGSRAPSSGRLLGSSTLQPTPVNGRSTAPTASEDTTEPPGSG